MTAANPATNGETLVIYCTALGAVNNTPAAGSPSPSSPLAVAAVTPAATIGNMPARVTFAGLVPGFIGLSQVNVEVPASARPVPGDPEGSVVRVLISSGALQSNSVLLYMR